MSDEEADMAPVQNAAAHFSGNIMSFERRKFNARQENRLEALKAFKKKCGYIFKGSLVNISEERKCILVQDWLGPEGPKIYDSLDWGEDEDVNNYELMWTKLEGAVSAECNEIEASKKFKERVQKPKETITDLMLLVKDCNYIDEDRQVRDQFVYGVSDDDLKKKLVEKGNTLTRIQAVSIGEVRECCLKPPVSDSTNTIFKGKPHKGLMCNSFANKRHCPAWGAVCNLCKIPRNVSDSKKRENQNQVIKSNQDQLRNDLS